MSILPGAVGASFERCTLNATQVYNQLRDTGPLAYLQQISPSGATHDSDERYPAPKCYPHTRGQLIAGVFAWVKDPRRRHTTFWLYAPVGMGKTAIAQTVSELCEAEGLLAATFFFSRTAVDRNQATKLVSSLAFQLSSSIPSVKPHIENAITTYPAILTKSLPAQLQKLIIEPFSKLSAFSSDRLVVIDGLDETVGFKNVSKEEEQRLILELVEAIQAAGLPLIFLILSRPESWIKEGFESIPNLCKRTSQLDLYKESDADADIESYLRSEFARISRRSINNSFGQWPSNEAISELVLRASGQFLYATTVIRYIDESAHRPQDRLQNITFTGHPERNPLESLDNLYHEILDRSPNRDITMEVLGCLMCDFSHIFKVKYSPIRACQIICDWTPQALSNLHSIVRIDDGPPPSRSPFYHPNFVEFLESPTRSKGFHLRKYQYLPRLLEKCFAYLCTAALSNRSEPDDVVAYALHMWHIYRCNDRDQFLEGVQPENAIRIQESPPSLPLSLQHFAQDIKGTDSQDIINTLQWLLDHPAENEILDKVKLSRLLFSLSKRLRRYPQCLVLRGVVRGPLSYASGSFSDVWRADFLGQGIGLKVVKTHGRSDVDKVVKAFSREGILWSHISHLNILPFYGLYRLGSSSGEMCLVSPWMDNGTLPHFLKENTTANRVLLMSDVAHGLRYLHSQNIIHGDLKGQNVLIQSSGRACLADFGLSCVGEEINEAWSTGSSACMAGTMRWQAPELLSPDEDNPIPTAESDIFAFSSVCYEIFVSRIPFYERSRDIAVIFLILQGRLPTKPMSCDPSFRSWGLTEQIWGIMEHCWSFEPAERPSIEHIINSLKLEDVRDDRPGNGGLVLSPSRFRQAVYDMQGEEGSLAGSFTSERRPNTDKLELTEPNKAVHDVQGKEGSPTGSFTSEKRPNTGSLELTEPNKAVHDVQGKEGSPTGSFTSEKRPNTGSLELTEPNKALTDTDGGARQEGKDETRNRRSRVSNYISSFKQKLRASRAAIRRQLSGLSRT
ncbi:hypothetical protein FA15DRAFT_666121 [Coprinopsis marcescibilis]|uniref:Protein kinase domain-containing protein n=1 Tax=Coprinopsis marcescibilis TaxID=230819 RepID=A0A5C3LGK9_COPMA|nr:hypothetical protein FA15DRAFT_666121 [Coprinopsis marcescibilis]